MPGRAGLRLKAGSIFVCLALLPGAGQAQDLGAPPTAAVEAGKADPRSDDPDLRRAARLLKAIRAILKETADNRHGARRLPSENEFLITPLWTET